MSDFQTLVKPDGRVQTALGIPANTVYFRGFLVDADTDNFIVKEWNGVEEIFFNAGIAVNSLGVILINGGAPSVPNLVPNGNFSNGTTGWVASTGSIAEVAGELVVTTSATIDAWGRPAAAIPTEIGKEYTFAAAMTAVDANHGKVNLGTTLGDDDIWLTTNKNAPFNFVHIFTATATELYIQLQASPDGGAADDSTTWDNVQLNDTAATGGGNPTDSGLLVDANGILYASAIGLIDVIHQELGLDSTVGIGGILQITNGASGDVPDPPTNLVAVADLLLPQIQLTWDDNSTTEAGYRVERSDVSNTGPWVTAASLPAGSTAYLDTGLNANTQYWYRVFAYNGQGDSLPSNVATATVGDVVDQRVTGTGNVRVTGNGDRRVAA